MTLTRWLIAGVALILMGGMSPVRAEEPAPLLCEILSLNEFVEESGQELMTELLQFCCDKQGMYQGKCCSEASVKPSEKCCEKCPACCKEGGCCASQKAKQQSECSSKQYVVQLKLIESRRGEEDEILAAPQIAVLEDQKGHLFIGSQLAIETKENMECVDTGLSCEVKVVGVEKDQVRLDLGLRLNEAEEPGKCDLLVFGKSVRVVQKMKLGTLEKLNLGREHGVKTRLEVIVKEVPEAKQACPTGSPTCPKAQPTTAAPRARAANEVTPTYVGPQPNDWVPVPHPALMPMPGYPCYPVAMPVPSPCSGQCLGTNPPLYVPGVNVPTCCAPSGFGSGLVPCSATEPAPAACTSKRICVVSEDGKNRLEVKCGGPDGMTCENLSLKIADHGFFKFVACGKQVAVVSPDMNAMADNVTTDQHDRMLLEGHVRLRYHKDGQRSDVSGDRVAIDLADGPITILPGTKSSD